MNFAHKWNYEIECLWVFLSVCVRLCVSLCVWVWKKNREYLVQFDLFSLFHYFSSGWHVFHFFTLECIFRNWCVNSFDFIIYLLLLNVGCSIYNFRFFFVCLFLSIRLPFVLHAMWMELKRRFYRFEMEMFEPMLQVK